MLQSQRAHVLGRDKGDQRDGPHPARARAGCAANAFTLRTHSGASYIAIHSRAHACRSGSAAPAVRPLQYCVCHASKGPKPLQDSYPPRDQNRFKTKKQKKGFSPVRFQLASEASRWFQNGPRRPQEGPKTAPSEIQDGLKALPGRPQDGPERPPPAAP